ncbi:hypothetical protein PDIDSM_8854 [Penicillium digitatum]|nr:hypothetical protein PDIDSM_8854 [Penicillium digitatum]
MPDMDLYRTWSRGDKESDKLFPSSPRFNEIGVQQLSDHVHAQVFPNKGRIPDPELVALSKDHLARHELLGKSQNGAAPVAFDLPTLKGQTLDEHFYKLGMDSSEPTSWLNHMRAKPRKWVNRSGWKYHTDGTSEPVDAPNESMLTFDTEVM